MLEVNKENFETEVKNYTEKPVFVDFWGDKCEVCKQLMPDVHKLEEKYGDKIKFCSLNTSSNRRLAIGERVLGLPTMIMYKNGEKAEVLTPDKISSIADVEEMVKKFI
ncbi:MAG TPA: thiol reductase thioredoxin [Clostridiaceae bacterium]|jgi:thioredoxin 1|nr:thiol reductase thioredoxin [Clostridiaceae bacterium]HBG39499.1 thiol reductase thioredoxin [Clostridiaceae bacterium]HBN29575.1 thiol reductase thioredoxin [Clostridiaceae bacterium]HBX47340.1 thiol reductase thioredoxin [Clostridiaceae bacterium]HCL50367.1 thiol reductase thioredoxin [Clostridiaceae bacterium]